jgi:DNA (cytosine-5)-methyltransferase 3A
MKREHMNVINNYCGLFAVNINSNRVSAQNRNRWYWSNIRTKQVGLFGETHTDIPQPKDRGILLKDILEKEVPEKYYLSSKMTNWLDKHDKKSKENGNGFKLNLKNGDDKGGCISSGAFKQNPSADYVCVSIVGRKLDENGTRKDNDPGIKAVQRLEPNFNGKTNCLTSVQKDNLLMQLNERQQNNFKNGDEKANTFLSTSWKGSQANGMTLIGETRIRRLTPTECARLQTIPEWYKWGCSDTQQYRMLGNGWTVQVIAHILSFLQ